MRTANPALNSKTFEVPAMNLVLDFDFIEQCAEIHGMVRRLRADGHACVALHRNSAAAG